MVDYAAYCEGWPVYHAIYEPESGAIYAAAASEWQAPPCGGAPTSVRSRDPRSEGIA